MGRFEVDPGELQDLSRRLAALTTQLRGMGDRLRLGQTETGTQAVAEALGRFAERWDYSLRKLAESASNTAIDLRTAGDGYVQVDDALAEAFDGDR
jgi:uncharacterized protein YukE